MSVLSSRVVGKGTLRRPQEQNPKGQAGQSGEKGQARAQGQPASRHKGESTGRAEGPRRDTHVCLLSWGLGAQRALAAG